MMAITCIRLLSKFPYVKLHTFKKAIIKTLSNVCDDRKRCVRKLGANVKTIYLNLS